MAESEHDLVIRGGTVVDGTGNPGYAADVGVRAGRISGIGRIGRARQTIDADGLVVTPGFIDAHTHMDAQVFWDPLGTPSCWHGVTTVVMGHCGFTLAPADPDRTDLVLSNLERAEDMSRAAMAAGIDWTWSSFAEYLDAVERCPKGINYAANVGHSAVRTFVMGERAFEEEASPADLAAMSAVVTDAVAAGAIGWSTSRTKNHETVERRAVASRIAAWDEVRTLTEAVGRAGGRVFQLVEDAPTPEERPERDRRLLDLAKTSGMTIAFPASGGGRALELLDAAKATGGRMVGLTHCRGVGSLMSFRGHLPFDVLPGWREVRSRPLEEQRAALLDPGVRRRLVDEANHGDFSRAIGAEARRPEYDRMVVLRQVLPPNPTVAELAAERRLDPVELIIELSLETDFAVWFMQTISAFDPVVVKGAMSHPDTVMTFSDAGAHVSQISDSSIQTYLLAYWVRERGDFSIEDAVRMMTSRPAHAWGFRDRGEVREGFVADLNVIDPSSVAPGMPELVHDLPAGEPRIRQKAVGIAATVVAGRVVHRDGEHTGALPGRLLRGWN